MNFNRLMLSAAMVCGIAGNAQASRDPTPPPSGVVIHLFGPNSITSRIVPDLPGENSATSANPPAGSLSDAAPLTEQTSTASGGPPQPADSDDPTMGAVLHQMFVTGDPDHPNQPSVGRAADRPPGGN